MFSHHHQSTYSQGWPTVCLPHHQVWGQSQGEGVAPPATLPVTGQLFSSLGEELQPTAGGGLTGVAPHGVTLGGHREPQGTLGDT